jgi:hypothetical protein
MSTRGRRDSLSLLHSWLLLPLAVLLAPVLLPVLAAAPLLDLRPEAAW